VRARHEEKTRVENMGAL
jgi:hypothetical protein